MKEKIQLSNEVGKSIRLGARGAGLIASEIGGRFRPIIEPRVRKALFDLLWKK